MTRFLVRAILSENAAQGKGGKDQEGIVVLRLSAIFEATLHLLTASRISPRAGVIGLPLALLILLDHGVGPGLLLFDRLLQNPVLHTLPLHLPLMIIKDTVECIGVFFRLLTAFSVQLTRVVHALAGSNRPPLHILQPFLQGFSFFRHFGVGNGGFGIAVVDIETLAG